MTGTAQNFILLDGNENPNTPTSAVFQPHWLFVPLEIVGNPWLQTGHAGATNLAEGLLLAAALGRDAAEMAKNLRDLACKEPEPCSPGLKGFLLNSWGFYTVVFWSNFLCSLIFLWSRQGNVLLWSSEFIHFPWSGDCPLRVFFVDGGIHICTEKSKWLCLAHGWRCIWKAHQQNQLCLGVLCASRRSFVKSLGDDLSSWAFKNRFSCIFLAKEKCFLSNQNEACGLILSPKTQVCSWTFHGIDSGRFLQCAWLYSSVVNGENFLRQSESVCFDWLHPAVVLALRRQEEIPNLFDILVPARI